MVIDHKRKFVFICVPKTACSSMRQKFKANMSVPPDIYHMPLKRVLREHSNVNDYFRFGFVRNPWDRFVSLYFDMLKPEHEKIHQLGLSQYKDFNDFALKFQENEKVVNLIHAQTQFSFLEVGGEVAVDFVGRFEKIRTDFDCAAKLCNFDGDTTLGHYRQSCHDNYRTLYTEKTKNIIAKYYAIDIERFGYEF